MAESKINEVGQSYDNKELPGDTNKQDLGHEEVAKHICEQGSSPKVNDSQAVAL